MTVVNAGTWGPRVRSDRGKSWEPAHRCTIACDCSCLVTFRCLLGRSITSSSCTRFYCSTTVPSPLVVLIVLVFYCLLTYKSPSLLSLRRQVESLVYPLDNTLDLPSSSLPLVRYKWVLGRTLEQEPLLLHSVFKSTPG